MEELKETILDCLMDMENGNIGYSEMGEYFYDVLADDILNYLEKDLTK